MVAGMNVEPAEPSFEARDPQLLTFGAVLVLNAFGFLAFVPVLLSFAVVSVIPFGLATLTLPLAMLCAVTFFLPVAFGNPYIQYLAGKIRRTGPTRDFLVQVTCRPRRCSGPRGILEDADDIGWLEVAGAQLVFQGDALSLKIPRQHIRGIRLESIGWRGFFLTRRTLVQVEGFPGLEALEFTERASWMLMQSRRIGLELHKVLESLCK